MSHIRPFAQSEKAGRATRVDPTRAQRPHPLLGLQRTLGNQLVQRYVFFTGKQQAKDTKGFTPEMSDKAGDELVRDYKDKKEFERHLAKETDYIGNLKDRTWVRFSPDGINVIGERHSAVTLNQVLEAVNARSFIYEGFAADPPAGESHLSAVYETETKSTRDKFHVEKDTTGQLGAESLYPKIGVALAELIPYFKREKFKLETYDNETYRKYLCIAWGVSRDNAATVARQKSAEQKSTDQKIAPALEALAGVHTAVAKTAGAFIEDLEPGENLGQALNSAYNEKALAPLAQFAAAFLDAIPAMAPQETSDLPKADLEALADAKASVEKKKGALALLRNLSFLRHLKAAADRKVVRYAGMGRKHLAYLVSKGLPKDCHAFDMVEAEKEEKLDPVKVENSLANFKKHTADLTPKTTPKTTTR